MSTHDNWKDGRSVKLIASNSRSIAAIAEDSATTTKHVRINERLDHGVNISYMQAYRAQARIARMLWGEEAKSFQKIPALLQKMRGDVDNDRHTAWPEIDIDAENRCVRCAVFPVAHVRNFYAMDGAHCTATHRMTLLAITTLDGNNDDLSIAWGLVSTESEEHWAWFLRLCRSHLSGVDEDDSVIMSDWAKVLIPAISANFPHAKHAFCAYHLKGNVEKKFGKECAKLFWRCA